MHITPTKLRTHNFMDVGLTFTLTDILKLFLINFISTPYEL